MAKDRYLFWRSYYDALMKLYSMLPEESGLNGITSLSDVTEKIGMEMQMEIDEALNAVAGIVKGILEG